MIDVGKYSKTCGIKYEQRPGARELLDRYEASTTRSQYVSLVNLIGSGHTFGQHAFLGGQ